MNDDVEIYNYFQVRWEDGYGFVSDAPKAINLLVSDDIESRTREGKSYFLSWSHDELYIALVKHESYLPPLERNAAFVHVFVVQSSTALTMDEEAVRSAFEEVHGIPVGERIHQLHEDLCVLKKANGRSRLSAYHITLANIKNELRVASTSEGDKDRTPTGKPAQQKARTQPRTAKPERALAGSRERFSARHLILILAALLAIETIWIIRTALRDDESKPALSPPTPSAELLECRRALIDADAEKERLNAKIEFLEGELADIKVSGTEETNLRLRQLREEIQTLKNQAGKTKGDLKKCQFDLNVMKSTIRNVKKTIWDR
ncbi:MAG: hypothetical protein MJE77_14100 [Proteobacteria bacterium]|nr:hypothetical protein [Pseudomonadota bacterium]